MHTRQGQSIGVKCGWSECLARRAATEDTDESRAVPSVSHQSRRYSDVDNAGQHQSSEPADDSAVEDTKQRVSTPTGRIPDYFQIIAAASWSDLAALGSAVAASAQSVRIGQALARRLACAGLPRPHLP